MSGTGVRTAQESERSRVVATITAGFITDPVARWGWPEAETYLAAASRFINAYGGQAFEHGCAWIDDACTGVTTRHSRHSPMVICCSATPLPASTPYTLRG